jgi:DNA-binding beta-propeller fold protein YncE
MTLSIRRDNHDVVSTITDTVTCCDLLGITQWEFKDERVLKGPRGISIDNDGNVYVVGYSTNNVVVISPDGQRHRKLLASMKEIKCNICTSDI